jgi:transmembrane sensor
MSRSERAEIEAANWIISQSDGRLSDADQTEFDSWFAASEGNKAAYWRLKLGWEEADRIGALGHDQASASFSRHRIVRRWWVPSSIAASLALIVGAQVLTEKSEPARQEPVVSRAFATAVGARKSIGLPDGSRVQLNTGSKVRAAVTARAREIWLDQGEAFFEVAHNEAQPFVVHAGDRTITVLGTKFSVRREGAQVTVAVLEGRVRVDEPRSDQPTRSMIIVGGDIALAKGTSTMVTSRSDERVEDALSWRSGMLSFEQDRLSDIAAEFNRYNVRKMVVTDPEASAVRIAGVFPANDPEGFVELLRDAYGLKVQSTATTINISN